MIRRLLATCAAVLCVVPLAAACGDDEADACGDDGSTGELETIAVTVENGAVTPDGDRVDVGVDQPVDLVVTSDVAGELHVHSSPEQTLKFSAGENDPIKLQYCRAGLVDIELHEPAELPVVQLRVT